MSKQLADKILTHVRGQKSFLISLLRNLVEAESPSSRPDCHRRTRRTLMSALGELGYSTFETGVAEDLRHVYARPAIRKRGVPYQLIVGHYDTVWPIGTINKRPFAIDGKIVRGPGVFDMKGGLAQLAVALETIRKLDLSPPVTPIVFVNSDEEIGSPSSTRYIRMLARRADRALVLEPALGDAGKLKTERKGVGRFTVTVFGKAAHAGLDPESGASAILELSHIIQELFAMNDADRGISINVGTVDGGIRPNVIAPNSSAVVDVRVPTLSDGERIERQIRGLEAKSPGIRLRVEGFIGRPAMEATPGNRDLWEIALAAGAQLGLQLEQAKSGGASDGNTTSQYTPTLDGLGAVGGGAHAAHEFLEIDKTLERAALLTMLLMSPSMPAQRKS